MPLPEPLLPEVIVIKELLLVAVHAQPLEAMTLTVLEPAGRIERVIGGVDGIGTTGADICAAVACQAHIDFVDDPQAFGRCLRMGRYAIEIAVTALHERGA